MKVSATTMPSGVNATFMPSGASQLPSQPFGAYRAVNAMPATAVGSANGRSTMASIEPLEREGVAHQHPGDDEAENQH